MIKCNFYVWLSRKILVSLPQKKLFFELTLFRRNSANFLMGSTVNFFFWPYLWYYLNYSTKTAITFTFLNISQNFFVLSSSKNFKLSETDGLFGGIWRKNGDIAIQSVFILVIFYIFNFNSILGTKMLLFSKFIKKYFKEALNCA